MKILLLATLLTVTLLSCEKEPELGGLNITVSYYFENTIDFKSNMWARAFLFKQPKAICPDFSSAKDGLAYFDGERCIRSNMCTTSTKGEISIKGMDPGNYYLLLTSYGRNTFSDTIITIGDGEHLELLKIFGDNHEFEKEPW
jgi:hypothetical protein